MEKEIVDRLIFKSGMTAKDYKFEQEIPKRSSAERRFWSFIRCHLRFILLRTYPV